MNTVDRMSKADLEKHLKDYLYGSGDGDEEYRFNIRMRSAWLPDEIVKKLTPSQQDDLLSGTYREALEMFMDEVRQNYKWVSGWRQDGRSGGWLVIGTSDPVLDQYGRIPEHESEKGGPKDWSPLSTAAARQRIKDLDEIDTQLRADKKMLAEDMLSMKFWGAEKYWNRRSR